MRVFNQLVFDEWLMSGTDFSGADLGTTLGQYDALAIQVITEQIDVAGSINLRISTSADGINFINKNATAEITGAGTGVGQGGLSTGITNVNWGFDTGVTPGFSFFRFALSFTTTTRGRVQVFITARDTRADGRIGVLPVKEGAFLTPGTASAPARAALPSTGSWRTKS